MDGASFLPNKNVEPECFTRTTERLAFTFVYDNYCYKTVILFEGVKTGL